MIKAIVYKTNTGFTQRYAQMLSERLNVTCIDMDSADRSLNKGDAILFMGCLSAGNINGYKKAEKKFDVRAVAAVGMTDASQEYTEKLKTANNTGDTPLFYLRGGMDVDKLKGIKKKVLMMVINQMKKAPQSETGDGQQSIIAEHADFVDAENLKPIIEWYRP